MSAFSAQRGFTYIGLLFAIAILGMTLATIGIVWSTEIRRDKEAELLWIGDQYRVAIERYVSAGGQYPQELSDLLEDKRFPVARRYLRKLFPDPMTGQTDWQLVPAPDNGIMGIASSSQGKPIKVAGFTSRDAAFNDATCYCEWQFTATRGRTRGVRPSSPAGAN